MWVTSASWASISRARSSTRSHWAARRTRTPQWAGRWAAALPYGKVADAVDTLVKTYLREHDGEHFLDTFRRTGVAPFKEAVYADVRGLKDGVCSRWPRTPSPTSPTKSPMPPGDVIHLNHPASRRRARRCWARAVRWACGSRATRRSRRWPTTCHRNWLSVALAFPKFGDGRAYSYSAPAAGRFSFQGEVRAVGDVLREQANCREVRCGFDAFEPADGSTLADWERATQRYRHVYQRSSVDRAPAFTEAGRVSLAYDISDRYLTLAARLDAELRHAHPRTVLEEAVADLRRQAGARLVLRGGIGGAAASGLQGEARHAGAVSGYRHAVRPDARLPPTARRRSSD